MKIVNAKRIQAKSTTHQVIPDYKQRNIFRVTSSRDGDRYKLVVHASGVVTCACPWGNHQHGNSSCSHASAVRSWIERVYKGRQLSYWTELESAERQHRPINGVGNGLLSTSRKVNSTKEVSITVRYSDNKKSFKMWLDHAEYTRINTLPLSVKANSKQVAIALLVDLLRDRGLSGKINLSKAYV